jgi:hypothetical protein
MAQTQQVLCNDGMHLNITEAMTTNVEIVTETVVRA